MGSGLAEEHSAASVDSGEAVPESVMVDLSTEAKQRLDELCCNIGAQYYVLDFKGELFRVVVNRLYGDTFVVTLSNESGVSLSPDDSLPSFALNYGDPSEHGGKGLHVYHSDIKSLGKLFPPTEAQVQKIEEFLREARLLP